MEGQSPAVAIMGALESMSSEDSSEKDLEDSEAFAEFMAGMLAMGMMAEDSGEKDPEDGEAFADFMAGMLALGMMAGEEDSQFPEIVADGYPDGLAPIAYRVTNNAVVKVRDLAAVGVVIDEVVQAAGDAARVEGVWFSAEDTTEARSQAREMAMKDAVSRADELAAHAGATRGKLLNVSEDSFGGGAYYDGFEAQSYLFTAISEGELDITVSVRATFAIE